MVNDATLKIYKKTKDYS